MQIFKNTVIPINKKITVAKIVTISVAHTDGLQEGWVILALTQPSPSSQKVGFWESLFQQSSLFSALLEEFEGRGKLADTVCAWDEGGRRRHGYRERGR